MIALDSSALIAIALKEPETEFFTKIILNNECVISWPTILEIRMVTSTKIDVHGMITLDAILAMARVKPVYFDEASYKWASFAFETYGKGRHKAGLNYGDCMAYAIAKTFDAPLLFKGLDFIHTDIKQACL